MRSNSFDVILGTILGEATGDPAIRGRILLTLMTYDLKLSCNDHLHIYDTFLHVWECNYYF